MDRTLFILSPPAGHLIASKLRRLWKRLLWTSHTEFCEDVHVTFWKKNIDEIFKLYVIRQTTVKWRKVGGQRNSMVGLLLKSWPLESSSMNINKSVDLQLHVEKPQKWTKPSWVMMKGTILSRTSALLVPMYCRDQRVGVGEGQPFSRGLADNSGGRGYAGTEAPSGILSGHLSCRSSDKSLRWGLMKRLGVTTSSPRGSRLLWKRSWVQCLRDAMQPHSLSPGRHPCRRGWICISQKPQSFRSQLHGGRWRHLKDTLGTEGTSRIHDILKNSWPSYFGKATS